MTTQVRVGGTWQPINGCQVYAAGAWRNIQRIQVYSGGAWRQVAAFVPPLSLAISPSPFSAASTSYAITSGTITATPSGGASPYTYSWSVVSSTPTTVLINSPAFAATTVNADTSSGDVDCTLQCTVTDAFGTSVSTTVDGTFHYRAVYSGGGGGGGPTP